MLLGLLGVTAAIAEEGAGCSVRKGLYEEWALSKKSLPRGSGKEALLAAALAQAFALPSFRAPARDERRIRRVVLLGGKDIDTRYAAAAARGTNLARWLTALPPNILDARGYRQAIARLARAHGLALRWLDPKKPENKVFVGAFYLVDPKTGPEQAKQAWDEAAAAGVDVKNLLPLLQPE